jgi:2-polyprenyl-6-methoxyphenol hydroxylase-like FAD-dependent oxidoreductase
MSSSPFQVVIIGGGIGGLSLAQALKPAGVSVAVYERDRTPTAREQGYRIHINPTGSRALHECLPPFLWEVFVATAGVPLAGMGFLTEQLQELVVVDEELMSGGATGAVEGQHAVSRIALRQLLLAGLADVVHFDKTFERYERTPDGKVIAYFADGTSATGDVLVGADGANSKVRQHYLPQARRVATDAIAVGGKLLLTEQIRAWLPHGLSSRLNSIFPPRHFMFTAVFDRSQSPDAAVSGIADKARMTSLDPELLFESIEDDDYILWAFIAHRDAYPSGVHSLGGGALQRLVEQMIAGWHPHLHRLVGESDPDSVALFPLKTSVPIEPWASTNITLLGDAIHSMTPLAGLGGNMALRDASLLARTLTAVHRGESPLLPAIHTYEAEMIAYGFAAVRTSLQYTRQAISGNRIEREISKTWFRICNSVPLLKRMTFGNRWTGDARPQPRGTLTG